MNGFRVALGAVAGLGLSGLLALSGCASTPVVQDAPGVASATPSTTPVPGAPDSATALAAALAAVFAEWDAAVAASDLDALYTLTFDLPDAVETSCAPGLEAAASAALSAQALAATDALDRISADSGTITVDDVTNVWGGYVASAREVCG